MRTLRFRCFNKVTLTALYTLILFSTCSCGHKLTPVVSVYPKHFKVQTPFILDSRGIIINTYWGSDRQHHVLCIDNHSPSWIKSSVIQFNKSFVKSKRINFKTSTADGTTINGDVGICDSIYFTDIVFSNIPFYVMPENSKDTKNDDGVFGIDALEKGIWKIDFRKDELTFASDADSMSEIKQSEIFPATFSTQSIKVKVRFGNNNLKTLAVDLGYNGDILIPYNEFKNISTHKKIFTEKGKFSTPASENIINNASVLDTISINHNYFFSIVSSNKKVTEHIIGLSFFRRFDYVIFDFINKRIYIPKKVW